MILSTAIRAGRQRGHEARRRVRESKDAGEGACLGCGTRGFGLKQRRRAARLLSITHLLRFEYRQVAPVFVEQQMAHRRAAMGAHRLLSPGSVECRRLAIVIEGTRLTVAAGMCVLLSSVSQNGHPALGRGASEGEQDKGALRAPGILRRNSACRVRFRW